MANPGGSVCSEKKKKKKDTLKNICILGLKGHKLQTIRFPTEKKKKKILGMGKDVEPK